MSKSAKKAAAPKPAPKAAKPASKPATAPKAAPKAKAAKPAEVAAPTPVEPRFTIIIPGLGDDRPLGAHKRIKHNEPVSVSDEELDWLERNGVAFKRA